jgi:NTE family protein
MTRRPELEAHRADGVFAGGGVRGLALAGAVAAARDVIGVREWMNVAGTSAGAIAAGLLVAGYDADQLKAALDTDYKRFADYGFGGKLLGGARNLLLSRGLVRGNVFREWLEDCFENSRLNDRNPRFRDLKRDDIHEPDLPDGRPHPGRYRLRVIASDITAGRMLVLPDDIMRYQDEKGKNLSWDDLSIVDAIRMSMSFPYFFEPVTLRRNGRPHLIVDGGLLSNFPIWLFDSPDPIRKTWGFRLYSGTGPEQEPYHEIPRLRWPIALTRAMFVSAMDAWDLRWRSEPSKARIVSIPTDCVKTLDLDLPCRARKYLYDEGFKTARHFFETQDDYLNHFGQRAAPSPVLS